MAYNQQLYNDLYRLRQKIKDREKQLQGRAPTVCSDSTLREIATLCPKKTSDFQGISGVGKTFIENYGEEFIEVILKHTQVMTEKTINLNAAATETLKELEKKLVNINRRNRLLYMPKLSQKYSFDMHELGEEKLKGLLFGKESPITLADIVNFADTEYQNEIVKFKRIAQLLREVNKDLRDKGQNDLYIGYPYVIGRIPSEDFDVRAPLLLFPVTAEKTATTIKLSLDESRDIIFNNALVLAYYKFNNITKPLPSEVAESITEKNLWQAISDFYSENDIYISKTDTPLQKFEEYKADEFPFFNNGELYLENSAVLGKFSVCSNSIQKDFNEILKNNAVNSLLNELLLNSDQIDYYSDATDAYNQEEITTADEPTEISEKDLVYINDLNSSQEAVLDAVKSHYALVVQGPPGTGKSQVITSLISDAVNDGQTVLMVSEKKTALDVVYSRLGNLSEYALLIDDVGNKEAFYQQLAKMVYLGQEGQSNVDLNSISESIDEIVDRLEIIAEKLYEPGDCGIEPYKLYIKSRRYDLSDENDRSRIDEVIRQRDARLSEISYEELENIHNLFKDEALCNDMEKFVDIITEYPWIATIRNDLSEYDTLRFSKDLLAVKERIDEWKAKGFFVRLLLKGRVTLELEELLSQYFTDLSNEMVELLFDNIDKVIESVGSYISYQNLKPTFDRLSKSEVVYICSLIKIKKAIDYFDAEYANNELFNALLYEHIGKFEGANRALFKDIENFDSIIRKLSEAINEKQNLSRQHIERLLADGMYNLTNSKRHGEILRILESKRKWSVSKFIKKFDFELFKSVKIWLLTPEVVSEIIPLQTGIFDLVIFDEASQMYVEKGIPSILRAKKVVIVGDHKQLRPSSLGAGRIEIDPDELPEDEEVTAALEEESLLDLARFKYKDILLNYHYRSKYEELIAFSNHAFYKGRLYVSPNAVPPSRPPIEVHKIDNALWEKRTNMEEAKYVVNMLKNFFKERTEDETIGIITFNSCQRDLIDELIDEECAKDPGFAAAVRKELLRKKNGEDIGLFVKNIESVQGDERDVIIFSIAYAKNESGKLIRYFGWLNQRGGENRLNVAISRARKKVHIVTSFEPHELDVDNSKNAGPRILKKYLEYAFAVSAGDEAAAKQVLQSFGSENSNSQGLAVDSELENQVYNALTQAGYTVDSHVGIGGYNIDLAIRKNDKYVLGIECDGRLYNNSKSARERDYHRQKYLEARDWKIYRLWSTNWWKDPQKEIQKIISVVESVS